ncbi:MAG: ComF family protein [Nitrospirae bacterium]|nr:MAG: ComF family protein [Nitrospirota bacterium]
MLTLGAVINILFPSACPVCKNDSDGFLHAPFCASCWAKIEPYKGPACPVCGEPAVSGHASVCGHCIKNKQPFTKVFFYGIYDGVLKEAIHRFKFCGTRRLGNPLGAFLLQAVLERTTMQNIDCIVPVPMHKTGLIERGFNQTAALAAVISEKTGTPLLNNALVKNRITRPQYELDRDERQKNLKGAFSSSGTINGLRVLLVDDVVTTGATVRECAKTLRKKGAADVCIAALARSSVNASGPVLIRTDF